MTTAPAGRRRRRAGKGEAFLPTLVAVIDAAAVPRVEATRPDGGRYSSAYVLVRRDGVLCGDFSVEFATDDALDPDDLERRVAALVAAPPPATPQAPLPAITVVIPTNLARPPEGLSRTLASIAAAGYAGLEVIVADNRPVGGGDPLPEILRSHPSVRWVHAPQPGISAARNAGIAAAHSEIVAFTDDDVVVDPGWLHAIGTRFATCPDVDVVTGVTLPQELETQAQVWFEQYFGGLGNARRYRAKSYGPAFRADGSRDRYRVAETDHNDRVVRTFALYGAGVIGAGANMAFRAEALARVGGFDTRLGTGTRGRASEEVAAMIQVLYAGGRIGYEPRAVAFHQHRAEVSQLRAQVHGFGLGFTAMLLSLIHHDRRHLLGIGSLLPAAVTAQAGAFRGRRERASAATAPGQLPVDYPAVLRLLEFAGYLRGPMGYLRGRPQRRSRRT